LHDVIIETREGVVKNGLSTSSRSELFMANVESSIELVVSILVMLRAIVNSSRSIGASHSSVFTISVNSPEVINTIVYLIVISIPSNHSRSNKNKGDAKHA